MLNSPGFTILVLMTVAVTAIFTPLIMFLYDPSKPYMVTKRRTIQHTPTNTDLVIVLSILDRESINGIIKLLELSSDPTCMNPVSIFALHLIELLGRTNAVFIDHDKQELPPKYKCSQTMNALTNFQHFRGFDSVKLRFFTAVTTKQTMYQDICELALEHRASLIVVPFHKGATAHNLEGSVITGDVTSRTVISHVLTHAPCSVAILVDKSDNIRNPIRAHGSIVRSRCRLVVLFLGGADCREALVYADRMVANNEDLNLTVVRFLTFNHEGETETETEKKLDDGTMTWFWVKNERNVRVEYREVVVEDGEQTVGAIQMMNDGSYDLWIVGRRQGVNPVLVSGLESWSEHEDLGVIGDYVASVDFSSSASVLVIQQQILRA